MKVENKKRSLINNTIILGIGTISSKCLSFLFIPLFSRWLTTSEYGNYDLYVSYVSLIIPFMTLATTEALFRFLIDENNEKRKKEIITNVWIICTLGIILISFIVFIVVSRNSFFLGTSFVIYLISEALYGFATSFLRGIRKLNIYALTSTISIVFSFGLIFLLVKINHLGAEGMLLGYAIAYFLTGICILSITKVWKYIDFKLINRKRIKDLICYSLPMIPNTISWWVVNVSDRTIIKIFLGSAYNGIYALANKIPSLCTTLFSVFHLSWQENISLTINDDDRHIYINTVFNQIIQVMVSICLPILSLNYIVFRYVFDITYLNGSYQVPILMISVLVNVMAQFLGGIFVALKQPKWNGSTTVISAIVNITVHFTLIKFIGIYAASVSTLTAFAVLVLIRLFILEKKYSINVIINKKSFLCMGIFILFAIGGLQHSIIISIILFVIGCISFLVINKTIVIEIIKKMEKVIKR